MTRLAQNDIARLLAAVQQVHGHTDFATLPKLMVGLQSELVPNELSSYTLVDKRQQRIEVVHDAPGIDVAKLGPRLMAHYHEHPVHQHSLKTKDVSARKISDFLTQNQFERTGIYNEFYKLLEVRFQASFFLFNNPEVELGMVLNRRFKDFSERDRAVANLLRPHFAQAYQNAKVFTEMRQWQERTQDALSSNNQGLLFLSGNFRIERMTGNCERWLKEYFGWQQNSSFQLPDKLWRWVRQQRELQDTEAALGNTRPPLSVERLGASLMVRFIQNTAHNVTLLLSEQRRLQADSFSDFGLTPREREVLLWISEGKSNPEIGLILGISARTVEKHVERLLAKLNVESRKAAMLKVLSRRA